MYDGIRLEGRAEACTRLLSSPNLKLFGTYVRETGEATGNFAGEYFGMRIKVFRGRYFSVVGSLHKFFNGYYGHGLTNSDQFELEKVVEAVRALSDVLNVPPQLLRVSNLEFGVNLNAGLPINTILSRMLSHNGRVFKDTSNFEFDGIEAAYTQYCIKAYNKSKLDRLPIDVLRFEVKIKRMSFFARREDLHLADLGNVMIWEHAKGVLVKAIENVQFYEPPDDLMKMSFWDGQFLEKAQYRGYWEHLKPRSVYDSRKRLSTLIVRFAKHPTTKGKLLSQVKDALELLG